MIFGTRCPKLYWRFFKRNDKQTVTTIKRILARDNCLNLAMKQGTIINKLPI